MVKGKHSKPRAKANTSGSMLHLANPSASADPPTQPQMLQANDLPQELHSSLDASIEPIISVTSTHDSHGVTYNDGDGPSSRSRGRGPSVGLHTPADPTQRLHITPLEYSSFFEKGVTTTITRIIKNHFHGPWPTWKNVPNDVKELMFKKFEEKFVWSPDQDHSVRQIWNKICSSRLRDMLSEERKNAMDEMNTKNILDCKGMTRQWIMNEIWDALIDNVWGTEGWQKKSEKARANRLTQKEGTITKHTGGSVPFVVHAKRMSIEMNRKPTFFEVFNRTHKRQGGSGDFVDNKSKIVSEKYTSALSEKYGEDSSAQPEFDLDTWTEVIGGTPATRTHFYGAGSTMSSTIIRKKATTFESAAGPSIPTVTSPASDWTEKEKSLSDDMTQIRQEMREFMASIKAMMRKKKRLKKRRLSSSNLESDE